MDARSLSRFMAPLLLAACHTARSGEASNDASVHRDTGAHLEDTGSGEDARTIDGRAPHDAGQDATLCTGLFGNPNAHTGLTLAECSPSCAFDASTFAPPVYDAAFIQSLVDAWAPLSPSAPLTSDPYDGGTGDNDPPAMVCGVLPVADSGAPRLYQLVTYASAEAAAQAGAKVTHFGHCGVCSTLQNLSVYMGHNDLVAPVRACGEANLGSVDADVGCLEQLGFDLPCAQAWAYDTRHTSAVCLSICFTRLSDPYNTPDGALDPCLACDEDMSGPVFKEVAGRTRRNSGLANAICRPCSEVQPLVHAY